MRAPSALHALVSATTLLVACSSTTEPAPNPSDQSDLVVLTVVPSHTTIDGGNVVQLTAQLSGANGLVPQSAISWFSSDTNVATVRAGGIVEGRKTGRIQAIATWEHARGSATVVVLSGAAKKPAPQQPPHCLLRQSKMARSAIQGC